MNKSIDYVVEFDATIKGVKYLLKKEGYNIQKSIITNVGTGTSIHYMEDDSHVRVGGTGIGGGTLTGLATIMTGLSDFNEITKIAKQGRRDFIDLFVKDIFEGMEPPIEGHLTASNFGKVNLLNNNTYPVPDLLATIQALVGEVITTLSIQYADMKNSETIIYIGIHIGK